MRNKILLFTLTIFGLTIGTQFITSCKKYPDGPEFSLRTRKERLANTWKVDNYKINGTDFTSLLANYTETFTKTGGYNYSWSLFNGSGTWSFQNKDTEVRLSGSDNQSSRTLILLKLKEKSLWYYYMEGNDKHEFHLNEK